MIFLILDFDLFSSGSMGSGVDRGLKRVPMTKDKIIRFRCSGCGKGIQAKPELAGKQVACPNCKTTITVPQSSTASTISDEKFGDDLAEILSTLPSPPSRTPPPINEFHSARYKTIDKEVNQSKKHTQTASFDPLSFLDTPQAVTNKPQSKIKGYVIGMVLSNYSCV
jgi:hypothetical protein